MKVIVHGEERIGFQFPEHPAQLLFDAVDRVEKIPAVHLEPGAAELPIRSQQKVIFENAVLGFR
jgi:hypothetical protein